MSGIYIPGMEMPKNCWNCELSVNCDACEGWEMICPLVGKIGYEDDVRLRENRMDNCPLIPVPEHGDLIDRDALKNKHHWTDDFYETEYVEVEDIDAAPTIIQAEEGGG